MTRYIVRVSAIAGNTLYRVLDTQFDNAIVAEYGSQAYARNASDYARRCAIIYNERHELKRKRSQV